MKVKLLPKYRMGIHTYSLSLDRNIRTDDADIGQVSHREQTIKIWTDAPLSRKNETLVHEVIEIGKFMYRVQIDDADIDRVAECVCEFLMNNLGIEFDWSDIPQDIK